MLLRHATPVKISILTLSAQLYLFRHLARFETIPCGLLGVPLHAGHPTGWRNAGEFLANRPTEHWGGGDDYAFLHEAARWN